MFSLKEIQDKAVGLVGFTSTLINDSSLKASRSGLTFEGGSALVNVNTIKSLIDNEQTLDEYLKGLVQGAFVEVLNSVFSDDDYEGGGLLYPYDCIWDNSNSIHGFIGYEIDTTKNAFLSLAITRLMIGVGEPIYYVAQDGGYYTDKDGNKYAEVSPLGTARVYLYNSQMQMPIAFQDVATSANNTVIANVEWLLNNITYGGKWYIGYFTSDLPSQPVAINHNLATLRSDINNATIRPIFIEGAENWKYDINNLTYTETRYGLNFDMSAYKDWTNLILSNEQRFARALQLMVAIKVADLAINSTRSNRDERISRANAVFELDGNRYNKEYPEHMGLMTKLEAEIKRLRNTYNPNINMKVGTLC